MLSVAYLLGLVEPGLHTSNELLCICFVQSTTFCNFLLFGYKPTGKILIFQHGIFAFEIILVRSSKYGVKQYNLDYLPHPKAFCLEFAQIGST
jgi:hypothetical protein